ncbi:nucleoside-diphosphate-sugar epimerase [Mucilaginibacter frigoritolerans]|uniref:Nucleoside-diphosphate-sugar epimerase n=1 Tax=Mucilaginibacter frigoritolerans TaxID=652788 RepID=A0A562TWY8_9SPHI|nr:NAD(P)-dependent oxidoreductase [Mucilaginibacter frigoritolerans]TWI98111.1 nucleoside-diphosphate-sugar epimerase [Mucilaginibacter frigoritolerans]
MKERVLITGASGFVGYHLIQEALKDDLEVYVAVRKSSKIDHLKNLDIKYTYPDFDNIDALVTEFNEKKYDYIIHAAGITKARSVAEYNHINADYTNNIASAIVKNAHPVKKMVLISSLAAVGPLNTLEGIITEDTLANPVTAYGKSKLLAEENLKTFSSLNYSILRPTGVYGPRDRDIFIFFKQVAKGIEPYIGNMQQKFSFIYVTDVAKAAVLALYAKDNQKTYNLSDGQYYDRYELGKLIKETLNLKTVKFHLPVIFVKFIALLSEKYSSLRNEAAVLNIEKLNELMAVNWYCDIKQARSGIDFSPEHDLRAGVTKTLKWYKANKWL